MVSSISRHLSLSIFLALASTNGASAFSTPSSVQSTISRATVTSLEATRQPDDASFENSRREILSSLFNLSTSVATVAISTPSAYASMLDDFGTDPSSITKKPEPSKKKELAVNKGKEESNFEPNLRSNYYYPTNKVRYLPRIKKCSDSIPAVAEAIGQEDWNSVRDFATVVADDTILPMKLYVSSLTGGGTNVKVGFAKEMMTAAKSFEKSQAALVKSVDKKDAAKSSAALESMSEALLAYRTSGKLLGPDGGGDIPSVDEIRRSTKRFRGEAFEAKVKDRDARLKKASEESASN